MEMDVSAHSTSVPASLLQSNSLVLLSRPCADGNRAGQYQFLRRRHGLLPRYSESYPNSHSTTTKRPAVYYIVTCNQSVYLHHHRRLLSLVFTKVCHPAIAEMTSTTSPTASAALRSFFWIPAAARPVMTTASRKKSSQETRSSSLFASALPEELSS